MQEQIISYLTMENIIYFILATIAFSIILFLVKQVSKVLAFIIFIGVIYYFWFAPQQIKTKVNNCITSTINKKEISPICKDIFRKK